MSRPLGSLADAAPADAAPGKASRIIRVVWLPALWVVPVLLVLYYNWQVDCYADCERQQRSVARALKFYAYMHEGELPSSLQALADADYIPAVPHCPSRHKPAYRYIRDLSGHFTVECAGRNHPPYGRDLPLWSTRRDHR